jgi:hypothetical protein
MPKRKIVGMNATASQVRAAYETYYGRPMDEGMTFREAGIRLRGDVGDRGAVMLLLAYELDGTPLGYGLTEEELSVIERVASNESLRAWRSNLSGYWETGNYPAYLSDDEKSALQRVRNKIGQDIHRIAVG